ncbi:hypothetical protein MF271_17720 (plasmid) [Deinococcus sp. KNUC1210]|uniref:hypothetical protein n=1 Tax=Deinococcus sp. KNUC1210 TaxID=2917691 RepID=UPI001EF10131|nr:hypothetical protein [Deinococcus sp. KNUC1210]ULH17199.1 hypothetical protein MF271_17720 [Deinococcus sp. KNUC1210]
MTPRPQTLRNTVLTIVIGVIWLSINHGYFLSYRQGHWVVVLIFSALFVYASITAWKAERQAPWETRIGAPLYMGLATLVQLLILFN